LLYFFDLGVAVSNIALSDKSEAVVVSF